MPAIVELEAAWREGRPDPVSAIENCGRAYLAFAAREHGVVLDPHTLTVDGAATTALRARLARGGQT